MTMGLSGADGSRTDEGAMKPKDLDDLLAAARDSRAEPSTEFLSRLLVDAYANIPEPAAVAVLSPSGGWGAVLRGWLNDFGAPAAGLASATAVGLWIGFAQPATLDPVTGALTLAAASTETTEETVELIPRLDTWLGEG
jgi:hypothetical protein